MSDAKTHDRRGLLALLVVYWILGVAQGLCFKQGGTDLDHRVPYFVAGITLGITSTWFMMKIYTRMNANLAMVVTGGVCFVAFQLAAWCLWRAPLTALQWIGIATVLAGTVMATWRRAPDAAQAPSADGSEGGPAQ